jgi:hypothetical protein
VQTEKGSVLCCSAAPSKQAAIPAWTMGPPGSTTWWRSGGQGPVAHEPAPHRDSASRLALEARRVHACPQHTDRTHSQKKRTQKGSSMHTDRRPVRRACRKVLGLHRARNRQWLRVAAGHSPGAPGAQKTAP